MFFPEKMKRIRLLVHDSMKEKAVIGLHKLGAVELTDFRHRLSRTEWKELLDVHPVVPEARRITTQLMSINRFLDVFSMVDPEQEEGFFKQLFAPEKPEKIQVEDLSGDELFKEIDSAVSDIDGEVSGPLEKLESMDAEKSELYIQLMTFEKIKEIDLPLGLLSDGPFVHAAIGVSTKKDYSPLKQEISRVTGGAFSLFEKDLSDSSVCILVMCLLQKADVVDSCLRKWDLERIHAGDFKGTPSEAISEIKHKITRIESEQDDCRVKIQAVSKKWRKRLKALRELLVIERHRVEAHTCFAKTRTVTAIEGWVPEKQAEKVAGQIESYCSGLAVVRITEPDEPVEKLPVKLDNPGILKHFELLVKLYAPPRYDEIDPTVLIFPTFLFFFGIMVTDAMYGLMTLLLGLFILRGGGKFYPLYKTSGLLLTLGGIATILLGAMTGGWFGNLATDYLGMKFLNKLIVLNPMVDVSSFLLFAIGVGVLHLNLGIVLGIIKNVRNRDIPSALQNIWIFFLEISLIFYYTGAKTGAMIFAVPALLFLLYAEKGMALFGVTGLLGDTLSYARLMALGLVSFGLAVAINALAEMVFGIHYVGWIIAILVLVVGHSFSFVLNLMGAFAHGIRLHFVEFFGKFYSGGGEEFSPFMINREITEEKP